MAYQNSNPFYGSSGSGMIANINQQKLALDNLLRRELKVGDPSDPAQIAQALLSRYKNDPRANAITQEAKGLPFLLATSPQVTAPAIPTSSDTELKQAISDVERDIQELTTDAILKDVIPEMQGWAMAVRSAIAEGSNSARFALDPLQRDKTFSIRRQLGDYARMSRLIGSLITQLRTNFRKLAQSLDEVANVFMVMMGEAMASVGFSGGRFMLQVPFSEMQARRDAAIMALRNLVGTTQEAYGSDDWPRGLNSYRELYRLLDRDGQGDLRGLLQEQELARAFDELLQRAGQGGVEGLRALGATAQIDLERFRRLIIMSRRIARNSPPLTAFIDAIELFVDAFGVGNKGGASGFRLLQIARPPILFYGLYGESSDSVSVNLQELIFARGRLADQSDFLSSFSSGREYIVAQMFIDKILYDLDRVIDLYSLGSSSFGEPERRAFALCVVIATVWFGSSSIQVTGSSNPNVVDTDSLNKIITGRKLSFGTTMNINSSGFISSYTKGGEKFQAVFERIIAQLSRSNATLTIKAVNTTGKKNAVSSTTDSNAITFLTGILGSIKQLADLKNSWQDFIRIVLDELYLQRQMESRWESLVRSIAPAGNIDDYPDSDVSSGTIFDVLRQLSESVYENAEEAFERMDSTTPNDRIFIDEQRNQERESVRIPADLATSVEWIARKALDSAESFPAPLPDSESDGDSDEQLPQDSDNDK